MDVVDAVGSMVHLCMYVLVDVLVRWMHDGCGRCGGCIGFVLDAVDVLVCAECCGS